MVVLVEQMPQAPGSGFGDIGFNIPAPDIGFNMPMPGGYPPQVRSPAMRVGAHTAHPKPCNDPRSISPRTHSLATRRSRETRRSRCVLSPGPRTRRRPACPNHNVDARARAGSIQGYPPQQQYGAPPQPGGYPPQQVRRQTTSTPGRLF